MYQSVYEDSGPHTSQLAWPTSLLHCTLLSIDIYWDTRNLRYPNHLLKLVWEWNHINHCDVGTDTLFPDSIMFIPGVYLAVYGASTEGERKRGWSREASNENRRGRAPTVLNLPVPALPSIFWPPFLWSVRSVRDHLPIDLTFAANGAVCAPIRVWNPRSSRSDEVQPGTGVQ